MNNQSFRPRIALCGGMAFTPTSQVLDKALLRLSGARAPRLTLIGSSPDPRGVFRAARGHFNPLGAYVLPTRIGVTDPQMDMLSLDDTLNDSQIIYFTDGSPSYLVEILSNSHELKAIRHGMDNGMMIIAQGASAMALCDLFWDGDGWEHGLGLLHGIAVLPHHERLAARFSPERLRRDLAETLTFIGVDEGTGAVLEGKDGHVVGAKEVTIYRPAGSQQYVTGQRFTLDNDPLVDG